jgi:hypothetical protein
MQSRRALLAGAAVLAAVSLVSAQAPKPLSPDGSSAAQFGGKWVKPAGTAYTLGGETYQGGKWIEITYGRPVKRGRDLWGTGPTYGQAALVGAKIWRAGANVTTQLTTEMPIVIGGKTIAPGKYTVFVDLKEHNWTFVLSTLKAQPTYDPNDKTNVWGGYNYVPTSDVVRVPMKLEAAPHAHEQLSWEFVDITPTSGALELQWDKVIATVPFTVGG